MPDPTTTPPLSELAGVDDALDWDPAVHGAFSDAASTDEPATVPYTPEV